MGSFEPPAGIRPAGRTRLRTAPWPGFPLKGGRNTSESDIPSTNHHPSWLKGGKATETATIASPPIVPVAFKPAAPNRWNSILVGHRSVPTPPPGIRS